MADFLNIVDWVRLVEIPAIGGLAVLVIRHLVEDSRFHGQALKALEDFDRTRDDIHALQQQMVGLSIEIASNYPKKSEIDERLSKVESRLLDAVADLKGDFRERLDTLTELWKAAR